MIKYLYKYYRISLDDEGEAESNSITSQRQIVEGHITAHADLSQMPSIEVVDDGHTGTNFDRPGAKQLFEAIRRGEVGCIVVKDLSRFGRKYLEVSKYLEQLFPYLGIRFIAVGDGYDSDNHKGSTPDIDVPVRNMLNALYSKDVSKKVKSAKQTQTRQGKCINAFAPYGYKKNPEDKHSLIIDEPAAQVVRRIYALYLDGKGPREIARTLNSEGVLTPSEYKRSNGSNMSIQSVTGALWSDGSVINILRNEAYNGVMIFGKVAMGELGTGKRIHKPKEDWIRVESAYPAIITQEMWDAAVSKRDGWESKRRGKPDTTRILYKKVRCGYCNHILRYRSGGRHLDYTCDTPKYTDEYGCQSGRYDEQVIVRAVKSVLQAQIKFMLDMEQLSRNMKKASKQSTLSAQASAEQLDREMEQLQITKRKLYERYKNGSLDKDAYFREREAVDNKISEMAVERESLHSDNNEQDKAVSSAHHFFSTFMAYQDEAEPSAVMVNAMVEAVHVFDKDRFEITFTFGDELERAISQIKKYFFFLVLLDISRNCRANHMAHPL
jgi:DNA invertase Pin-like site-specific DNA recombinase